MTDFLVTQSSDGGELFDPYAVTNELETAVYLSLFSASARLWFGDFDAQTVPSRVESKFYNFTRGASMSSANLIEAEKLANQDLSWLKQQTGVQSVNAELSASNLRKVDILITIQTNDTQQSINLKAKWGAD